MLLLVVGRGDAFVSHQNNNNNGFLPMMVVRRPTSSFVLSMAAVVELKPEPEGGEGVTPISTMPGSRMKKMVCDL